MPEHGGDFQIPAISVPYFDPQAGVYKTAAAAPLVLRATALASAAPAAETPPAARPTAAEASDTAPAGRPAGWRRAAGWAALGGGGVALVLWAVSALSRGAAGARGARRAAETRLRSASSEERPRQAAAQIEEAWREYLAARYELAPGTPSPQWPDELARRGVDPQAAERLKRLADDLHYLRYAPQLASAESLRGEVIERSRRLLRDLR